MHRGIYEDDPKASTGWGERFSLAPPSGRDQPTLRSMVISAFSSFEIGQFALAPSAASRT